VRFTIQQVARAAGVSSRTLRHYDDIGLLPARRDVNGYRSYGQQDLVRLQRILLLRELGLGLPAIDEVLAGQTDDLTALRTHLGQLHEQAGRIERQIASVQRTIDGIENKEALMADDMFDGFDNSQYREEVEQRWGQRAWADGQAWWSGLDAGDKQGFMAEHTAIAAAWAGAQQQGLACDSAEVQAIASRHAAWIAVGWQGKRPSPEALEGLADMYVADERFAANYGGVQGAQYVREGLRVYAADLRAADTP
jgi:DNA-binding transcriptional MerR regulator